MLTGAVLGKAGHCLDTAVVFSPTFSVKIVQQSLHMNTCWALSVFKASVFKQCDAYLYVRAVTRSMYIISHVGTHLHYH